jgi:hypothetical protein
MNLIVQNVIAENLNYFKIKKKSNFTYNFIQILAILNYVYSQINI